MEDMASLWSYRESIDEMRQKLLCTTLEFEQFRAEASEKIRKNTEYVKQLLQLLETTCQERDESRDQLQKLLNKFMPSNPPQLEADQAPLLRATMANSSITESTSPSETYNNYNSHGSSPVDSFFNAVSSPEFSNINQPLFQDSNAKGTRNMMTVEVPKVDHSSLVIENLVKGKPLPQRGKLVQAVLDSPPLLQSLLVVGPLPQWSNPPKLHQHFEIPHFTIKSGDAEEVSWKQAPASLSYGRASRALNSQACVQMSCGSSQMLSAPMFKFPLSGSCFSTDSLVSPGASFEDCVTLSKRQRLQ